MKANNNLNVKDTSLLTLLNETLLVSNLGDEISQVDISNIASHLDPELSDLTFLSKLVAELKIQGKLD